MSPVDNLPPTGQQIGRKAHREDRRLTDIERRRLQNQDNVAQVERPCVFSFPGEAVAGVRSGKWKNKNGDGFTLVTITCEDTGGSDCDVDVLRNGSLVRTVTLGSGIDYAEFAAFFSVGPTDVVQVETTSVGGQTEVTVLVE